MADHNSITFASLEKLSLFGKEGDDSNNSVLSVTANGQSKTQLQYYNFNDKMRMSFSVYTVELIPFLDALINEAREQAGKGTFTGGSITVEPNFKDPMPGKPKSMTLEIGKDEKGYFFGFKTDLLPKLMKYRFNTISVTAMLISDSPVEADKMEFNRLIYWLEALRDTINTVSAYLSVKEARVWHKPGANEEMHSGDPSTNGSRPPATDPSATGTYTDDIPF